MITAEGRKLAQHLSKAGYATEVVPVFEQVERRFAGYRHYNRGAHIVIGSRQSCGHAQAAQDRCPPEG